jgi:MinD superfamily P-loop ATPase
MTHDEMLVEIDIQLRHLPSYFNAGDKTIAGMKALRAVVELHKPCDMRCDGSTTSADADGNVTYIPGEKDCTQCMGCEYNYPCRTIQSIEKELG